MARAEITVRPRPPISGKTMQGFLPSGWDSGGTFVRPSAWAIRSAGSASPYAPNAGNAWNVNFNNGNDNANNKGNNNAVRLVRGGE